MEERLRIGECHVHILGTIAGFVPDGARVQSALSEGAVDCVALGIPPEDLEGLAAFATTEDPKSLISEDVPVDEGAGSPGIEDLLRPHPYIAPPRTTDGKPFVALDETQERFLSLVGRFGQTAIPSPDLQVAFRWASDNGRAMEALDMDDETHAVVYIRHNKFRHVLRSGGILKKLMKQEFADAKDAHELAIQWDQFQNRLSSLQAVERAREAHMAERLGALAAVHRTIVAVVPVARMAGVVSGVQASPS